MVVCWFGLATKKSSTALNSVSTLQRNWVTLTTLQRYLPRPQLWTSPSRNKVSFYPFLILAKREKWIAFLFYKNMHEPCSDKAVSYLLLKMFALRLFANMCSSRRQSAKSSLRLCVSPHALAVSFKTYVRIQLRYPDGTITAHAHLSFAWVKKIRKCC